MDDDYARRGKLVRSHRRQSAFGEDGAHPLTEFGLCGGELVEAALLALGHEFGIVRQSVGGHRRVVRRTALFVFVGDEQPLLQVHREARRGRCLHGGAAGLAEHDVAGARRSAPALLRGGDEHIDTEIGHRRPHRTRGDAVENEDSADVVGGLGNLADVVVRQEHPRGGLDVGSKHDSGLLALDRGDHVGDGGRRPGGLVLSAVRGGLEHGRLRGDGSGVEDLRPAEGEQTVAHDQRLLAGGQLTGHGFHGVAAAAGDDGDAVGIVGRAQDPVDVLHHGHEPLRHVVERSVGEDHRVFEQAVWVNIFERQSHIPNISTVRHSGHHSR